MKVKLGSVIATVLAMAVATAAYGTDYYVDANNGDDGWDGTTAAIPTAEQIETLTQAGEPIPGPRKTLHAMMSDSRVTVGDTVWAAEGDYNEGGVVNGSAVTVNRVQVKAGVTLCATGARDATFITGSGGSYDDGAYSNGAARCVFFIAPPSKVTYGYGIVKGFTLRNGRTGSTSEHGGASSGAGLLVECDLQNNGCSNVSRGGTMVGGTALRCRFSSSDRAYLGYSGTRVIDSLIVVSSSFYSSCVAYNSTFTGGGYVRGTCSTYNCFFIGNGAANNNQIASGECVKHYRTFSRYAFHATSCTTNETCRVVTAAETPYDSTAYRPLYDSVAVDAGTMSYYVSATNGWKEAWLAECGKDYYGGERVVNGTIDIGCGEMQICSAVTIADSSDGLVVEDAEMGESQIAEGESVEITFSRTLTSDRLCLGVNVDGIFHSFGGTTSDVPYAATFPYQFGHRYSVEAVYETAQKDWYVSPTGNNANKGYHKNCPRRTLDKAMELATANADNVVHAAAGVYDSFAEGADARSRVTVKAGVGLVADEWPLRETVIKGALDTSDDADTNGNGPNAVRCVYVNSGGYVRGFKLTGGRTVIGDGTSADGGGAYLASGALIDCEVTGNGCSHRGRGIYSGFVIRCYVHDQVCGTYEVYYGSVYGSYIAGSIYSSYLVLNCTVTSGVRANSGTRAINTYLSGVSNGTACTNCVFMASAAASVDDKSSYDEDTCRFSAALSSNIDENFRPKSPASPLVDFGSKALYDANFPSAWRRFKDDDLAGGQRVYNGQIDVGCGEYDYRPDFAALLGAHASISEMGPNVTTNDVPDIVVPADESITVAMQPKQGRATRYELVYTPDGGSQTMISETSAEAFSHTLDGACTVQSLGGHVGFIIMLH